MHIYFYYLDVSHIILNFEILSPKDRHDKFKSPNIVEYKILIFFLFTFSDMTRRFIFPRVPLTRIN